MSLLTELARMAKEDMDTEFSGFPVMTYADAESAILTAIRETAERRAKVCEIRRQGEE